MKFALVGIKEILICTECGHNIFNCAKCREPFGEDEKICCDIQGLVFDDKTVREAHFCKDCKQ